METLEINEPVCSSCKHLVLFPFCKAFPDGIPEEIQTGDNNHSLPFPGDGGIQFESMESPERDRGTIAMML